MAVFESTGGVGLDRTAVLKRMKDHYLPEWGIYQNNQKLLWKNLAKKRGTIIGGKRSLTSAMTRYVQSAGIAFFEHDTLATPRSPGYQEMEIIARAVHARVRFTGHVERAQRAGKAAVYANAVKELLRAAREEHARNKNRMLYLGDYQILAQMKSADHDTPSDFTLYGRNDRNSAAANRFKFGSHYLREEMSIAVVERAGAATPDPDGDLDTGYQSGDTELYVDSISNSDPDNPVITLSGQSNTDFSSTADGMLIVPWKSRRDSGIEAAASADKRSYFAGIAGLFEMVGDQTTHDLQYGLSRASNAFLESQVLDNDGSVQAYDEDQITLACDNISNDTHNKDEDEPDCVFSHNSVRREHIRQTESDRRFGPVQNRRGYENIEFIANGSPLPFKCERDCPPGLMWVLNTSSFGKFVEAEIHMPDDGERFVADEDAREVILVESLQMACKAPVSNALVDDIQYSVTGLVAA